MESFDEASLLAEVGEDGDDDFESHEEVEARLMRELAAMPDAHAEEETALLASIHGMQDEPDEGDLLMAQLLREEKERQNRGKMVYHLLPASSRTLPPFEWWWECFHRDPNRKTSDQAGIPSRPL